MSKSVSVGSCFHCDGYLAEDAWGGHVEALLAEYEEAAKGGWKGERSSGKGGSKDFLSKKNE